MRAKFINEKWNRGEEQHDVKDKVERSKKLPTEIKELIYPLIAVGVSYYKEGRVYDLVSDRSQDLKGNGVGVDSKGFFVYTHRARSKSYSTIKDIPQKDIDFIESTG